MQKVVGSSPISRFREGPVPKPFPTCRLIAGSPRGQPAMASLDLHTRLSDVTLFTVIATLGAPLEVTAASLAIETLVPSDAEGAARLRQLAGTPEQAATVAA